MSGPTWAERVAPDEGERFERLAALLRGIQHERAAGGPARRALHAKATAAPRATLRTLPGIPEWARVGIFASAAQLPALVRFSNGSGAVQADAVPDVRGMAVKVIGVPGRKLIPGLQDCKTQDFLGILTPDMPVATPDAFIRLVRAISGPKILALPRLIGAFGLLRLVPTLRKLSAGLNRPFPSLAEATWFTPAPIRWGEEAVKFAFFPAPSSAPEALTAPRDADYLHLELATRLRAGSLAWDLRIQRFVDETHTPIEDPSVAWDPAIAPWVAVGRLELPEQDLDSPGSVERARRVERLSFDPWHAPEEFRPLGAMMRARAPAYRESVLERGVDPEPEGGEPWLGA